MALPSEFISFPKPQAIKDLSSKTVNVTPANATSQDVFKHSTNNRILFNVPSYSDKAWLNPQKSFISFHARTSDGATSSPEGVLFKDGLPIFERLVVKAGNGVVLEDISNYADLSRLMANFDKPSNGHLTGDYRGNQSAPLEVTRKASNLSGKTFIHRLKSGVFGEKSFIPIGLFNTSGGYAFSIELYLSPDALALQATGEYSLENVSLQLEICEMPQETAERFNESIRQDQRVALPYSTYTAHRAYIPSNNTQAQLTINQQAKNVSQVMTVMKSNDSSMTYLGGSSTVIGSYQYRYGMDHYPLQKAELKDSTLALANAMASMGMLHSDEVLANLEFEASDFALVQSFNKTQDAMMNGLNTANSGAPIELELSLTGNTAVTQVISFVKQDKTLYLSKGGRVSMLDNTE